MVWGIVLDKKYKPKNKVRDQIVLFFTLLIFWLMLNGTLATDSLVIGIIVSLCISILFGSGLSFFTEFRATPQAFIAGFYYYSYFFKELIKSNLKLAAIVGFTYLIHIKS